jgi:pantothenate kinase
MTQTITARNLARHLQDMPAGRYLVALAGPPASGKSTLAEALAEQLNQTHPNRAAIIPMDGFHYDDAVLEARGDRPRKGAPHTFDVGGFAHLLGRLKANTEPEVAIPLFDRQLEVARAGAAIIPQEVELLLVEGNYLLLDRAPWDQLFAQFDLTVMIDVSEAELRRRLSQRWEALGFDAEAVALKVEENDLPNGQAVLHHSRAATFLIASDQ